MSVEERQSGVALFMNTHSSTTAACFADDRAAAGETRYSTSPLMYSSTFV